MHKETEEFLAAVTEGRPLPDIAHRNDLGKAVTLRGMAEHYMAAGWPVFPLYGKAPATKHGFLDASTSLAQLRKWEHLLKQDEILLGVRTGHADGGGCGYDCIDLDGVDGVRWLKRRIDLGGMPDIVGHAITPRKPSFSKEWGNVGGHHLYVKASGHGSHNGILPSIDYKAGRADGESGGYSVLPPSMGKSGNRYTWITSDCVFQGGTPQ